MNGIKKLSLKALYKTALVRNLSALILLCCSINVSANCEYIINSEWSTGFTASINITNSGNAAVSGWAVAWQYSANKITSSWNATLTGSNPYSATGLNWNSSIQPGQSVSFGFQGDKNSALAEVPNITGSLCNLAASSSSNSSVVSSFSSIATTSSSSKSSVSSVPVSSSLSSTSSSKSSLRSSSITSSSSSAVSSITSTSSSSITSTSSSSIANNQQCNWYGTLYPLCVTTTSGWGYENNKSCIAAVTCSAQPSPYGIVGGSSSSIKSSSSSAVSSSVSSSKSSVSSVKTSSSAVSSSVISSSSKSSNSSSSSAVSGILFEDNFESGAVNTQPAGWDNFIAWNYNTTNSNANSTYAVIESGKAYSGTKAIHFKGSLAQIVRKLPAGIQRLHLRAYVNLSKKLGNDATDNHEHIMGIKKTQDANNEIRVGQIKGVLGTNEVPSDNIAPKMDKWYGGTELSPNTWYCVETAFYADTAYDELYMWINGNLVHSITSANDWNNGPLGADWLSDKFNYVMFGFHSFSGNTADVWMDDIVVSTKPIGCTVN